MKNQDIRHAILESGLKYWQIAESLNVSDSTFTKWLRKELGVEKKQEILTAIEGLRKDGH